MDEPVEIVPGVHRLGTSWVNFYAVEDEGRYTVVDAAVTGYADTLDADLAAIGAEDDTIEAVVLTHGDADHTGLCRNFSKRGARVLVHPDADSWLRKPRPKGGDANPVNLIPQMWRPTMARVFVHFARNGGAKPPKFEGAETYEPGEPLDIPGRPLPVATPGHAAGHCVLLFESTARCSRVTPSARSTW